MSSERLTGKAYPNGSVVICYDWHENVAVEHIVENTAQTWQPDRETEETTLNTIQGKAAEYVIEKYFAQQSRLAYVSYDDIRQDDFKLHAPFDALIGPKNVLTNSFVNRMLPFITRSVKENGGRLNGAVRNMLRKAGVYTVEVKSTRVSPQRIALTYFPKIINDICRDDYFNYPLHIRKSDTIQTFDDYVGFVLDKGIIPPNLSTDEAKKQIIAKELDASSDVFIRVYTDLEHNAFYLMGYMRRDELYAEPHIKHFYKKGKSEHAIYFSAPITKGHLIKKIFKDAYLWGDGMTKSEKSLAENNKEGASINDGDNAR